jgi:hypothetical protein
MVRALRLQSHVIHRREQGELVRSKHNPTTTFPPVKLLAAPAGLLGGRESSASARPPWAAIAGLVLSLCVAFALVASSASASPSQPVLAAALEPALANSNPPAIRELSEEEIYSTHANIKADIESNEHEGTWHGEYATSPAGPWTAAGEGALSELRGGYASLGLSDEATENTLLHHLKPDTTYYARFVVESDAPTVSRTFEFTTLPAGEPEIAYREQRAPEETTTLRDIVPNTPTTAAFTAQIETNGAETKYQFEYTPTPKEAASWAPFTSDANGSISVAEDFANPVATLTGLTPETTYYVRVRASNEDGAIEKSRWKSFGESGQAQSFVESFTTPTAKPQPAPPLLRNVTASSVHITQSLKSNGFETHWRYEYATSETGAWTVFASGTISTAQAAAEEYSALPAILTGLDSGTVYYVRLFAENMYGAKTSTASNFKTSGVPIVTTFATHALHGEAVRVLGDVDPESVPTSGEQTITLGGATGGTFTLTFEGQTTMPIPVDAPSHGGLSSVLSALQALSNSPEVGVEGPAGGPYTVYFFGPDAGVSEPRMTADASGLTPSGSTVTIATEQEGGTVTDTHFHFEYVAQEQFEKLGDEGGFAQAGSTPAVDLGSGDSSQVVGQDLPGLKAGETYDYRIVATSTAPGNLVVDGAAHTLTAPVPAPVAAQAPCPNAQLRTGPSAGLPDCRAYEQVTPVDKEGSEELFEYGDGTVNKVFIGESGDDVALEAPVVNYGSGPDAGGSPYLFSRDPDEGWQMAAGSPQPETGLALREPVLFSNDLTQFAFSSEISTSEEENGQSKDVEYEFGPVGGPDTAAVSVPRAYVKGTFGLDTWVGASADFSKLFLRSGDHSLAGSATGTRSGEDLYEYSAGRLRQVNVGIGTCGASIAKGEEGNAHLRASSPHAVSADGSRVFFEAVPGSVCSEPSHLYMRVNGSETVDIGAYRFFAANAQGTQVLLSGRNGEAEEIFLYDTESAHPQPKLLFSSPQPITSQSAIVSEDMSSIYFVSEGPGLTPEAPAGNDASVDLYHYDIPDEKLSFIAQLNLAETANPGLLRVSPDGRYLYFNEAVGGLPGGAPSAPQQVFRYDSVENDVECLSCASSFDPEPKLDASLGSSTVEGGGRGETENGVPGVTVTSANGDFAFFDTAAALVPQDIDGELAPDNNGDQSGAEFTSTEFSPSSDVYEWRKDGVDGCAEVQGCLALISSGRGGVLNILLGSTPSGNDVFIYSMAQLAPSDTDDAGDIYDVRVDGGFPPPPPGRVECEGDACSTPPAAPNDPTSTLLPEGSRQTEGSKPPVVEKKAVKCAKGKVLSRGKCVKRKARSKRRRAKRAGVKRRAKR